MHNSVCSKQKSQKLNNIYSVLCSRRGSNGVGVGAQPQPRRSSQRRTSSTGNAATHIPPGRSGSGGLLHDNGRERPRSLGHMELLGGSLAIIFSQYKVIEPHNDRYQQRVDVPAVVPKDEGGGIDVLLRLAGLDEAADGHGHGGHVQTERPPPNVRHHGQGLAQLEHHHGTGQEPIGRVDVGVVRHGQVVGRER